MQSASITNDCLYYEWQPKTAAELRFNIFPSLVPKSRNVPYAQSGATESLVHTLSYCSYY